jgi:hypothetical protein
MTHATDILTLLASDGRHGRCDACVRKTLGIKRHQIVNSECRYLRDSGLITRLDGVCVLCDEPRIVNALVPT